MKLFDEEGNEVEALPQEEVEKKITETKTEFETKEKELNEQLEKYKDKDFNFKALREAKEEEKKKLMEQMTEKEKVFFNEIEALKAKSENFETGITSSYKQEALKGISTDEETQKKVLANYDRISDVAVTKEQVAQKMREAYNMLGENEINPVNSVSGTQSVGNIKKPNSEELTPKQKELAKEFGLSDEDIKKYGK